MFYEEERKGITSIEYLFALSKTSEALLSGEIFLLMKKRDSSKDRIIWQPEACSL